MPLPPKEITVKLDMIDCPELWFKFRTMTSLKYQEQVDVFTPKTSDTDEDRIKKMMSFLIIDWNIPEEDDGPVLPLPKDDPESCFKLNTIIVDIIMQAINDHRQGFVDSHDILNLVKMSVTL